MKIIPGILLSCESNAERRVFETLQQVDLGPDWIAYHSLNCSEHEYKHWAEIDFLLVGPLGAYVLEVKGGRVRRSDGIWYFTDRFGRDHQNSEGPFVQARGAMYALQGMLGDRYQLEPVTRDRLVFGFGVLFPDIDWDHDTPETPPDVVADRLTLAKAPYLEKFIRHLAEYWERKARRRCRVTSEDLNAIRQKVRPEIDVYPPLTLRIGQVMDQFQRLTDEQYERLDIIEENERVMVTGGAGTGKTYLMMQCARRERALGRRVLIVVESPVLAKHLRAIERDARINILAVTEIAGVVDDSADVLLVDEGQDLLDMGVFDLISSKLEGGLDHGRWRWFMDINNQAGVAGQFDPEALEHLRAGLLSGPPMKVPLRRNCRNTRELIEQVQLWTGADIGRTEVTGHGRVPKLVVVETEDSGMEISRIIEELLDQGVLPEEIGIVFPKSESLGIPVDLTPRIRRKLVPLDSATVGARLSGKILWSQVDRFKGLERPVVVAAGFDGREFASERVAELYVATTRANWGLWLLVGPGCADQLTRNMVANLQSMESAR